MPPTIDSSVDLVLSSLNVAAGKNLGRCMLDCGGKKIEPEYTSNTCKRISAKNLATCAFLKSERSGTFSKFMIIAILVRSLPYRDLSSAVSVGIL